MKINEAIKLVFTKFYPIFCNILNGTSIICKKLLRNVNE